MGTSEQPKQKSIENTGFANDNATVVERFIAKDGRLNVQLKGITAWERFSFYHYLVSIPPIQFFGWIIALYASINFLFATLYMAIGIEHLNGVIGTTKLEQFIEAYFFSSQTLTTVGYGRVSPVGFFTNVVSSLESMMGLIIFALITGLVYGRFTKPKAYIKFSDVALIAPFKEGTALMLRLAPTKKTTISDLSASVTLSMNEVGETGIKKNFFQLPLQLDKIMSLALSWTLVHPIDEDSPLFGKTIEEIKAANMHVIVLIRGFDEVFSNTVVARTEYIKSDFIGNARFEPMFLFNEADARNDVYLNKINQHKNL